MIKVIAHRGASGMVGQDNTLESFQKAIEIGADMVEFDVRQTKDKVLIVHHDKNFADTPIAWQTYSNIEKEAKLRGIHLPLFREVVELCHGKIYMDIEIKEHGFEKKIVKELHKLADVSEYSVKSFDDRVPYAIRKLDPEIKTGLLIGGTKFKLKKRFNELFPIRRLKACKADFVSPEVGLLRRWFIKKLKKEGYPIYVWTVNDKNTIKKLFSKNIDGIITDRPDIALEIRGTADESIKASAINNESKSSEEKA